MALHRTQVLLEPEQHRALSELARREHRSLSQIVREAVQRELERRQAEADDADARWRAWRQRTLELSARILARRGGQPFDLDTAELINEMRDERDDQIIANTQLRKR